MSLDSTHVAAFYRASLIGLRALDARNPRPLYFGEDADARWRAYSGELRESDRLDLVIRDAAVSSPVAFAPRVIFPLPGLADDEAFGPEWPGLPPAAGIALLKESKPSGRTPSEVLARAADAWTLRPAKVVPTALKAVGPAARVLAAGCGALLALVEHFTDRRDLDIAGQVLLVADHPGERQLLGLAVALLGSTRPVQLASTTASAGIARDAGFRASSIVLVSDDASPQARDAVARIRKELEG